MFLSLFFQKRKLVQPRFQVLRDAHGIKIFGDCKNRRFSSVKVARLMFEKEVAEGVWILDYIHSTVTETRGAYKF
jgi:hypothetical protein